MQESIGNAPEQQRADDNGVEHWPSSVQFVFRAAAGRVGFPISQAHGDHRRSICADSPGGES